MRKTCLLFLLSLSLSGLKAQQVTCVLKNVLLNKDLRKTLYSIAESDPISYAGPNLSTYKDPLYYYNCCAGLTCSTTTSCTQDGSALVYRVSYPSNYGSYEHCPLPAVIMFHSGAYSECSSYNQYDINVVCDSIASKGFVVFNVNYRVGVLGDPNLVPGAATAQGFDVYFTSAQQMLGIYRACQDARGAIRSIIQRAREYTVAQAFHIDTTKLFIGGMSAGSLIAMNAVYYQDQTMIDAVFPGRYTSVSNANILGSIDQDYYYGKPDINFITKVKGVLNMWGSLFVPTANISNPWAWFTSYNDYMPPVISFAGLQDPVFDVYNQGIYFSKNGQDANYFNINFGKETNCLLGSTAQGYVVPLRIPQGSSFSPNQYGIGSETIYTMFKNNTFNSNSVFTELYIDCQMEHGLDCGNCPSNLHDPTSEKDVGNTCKACNFQSNFGTNRYTYTGVYGYIASRATTFFQAIITEISPSLNESKWVEIENKRFASNTADNPVVNHSNDCDNQ